MPVQCMVVFCKSRGSIPGVSYFRLTAERHDVWLKALGRDPATEHLSSSNRVCSLHFEDEDFIPGKNKSCCLRPGAFPKLNLHTRRPLAELQPQDIQSCSYQVPNPSQSYDIETTSDERSTYLLQEALMEENPIFNIETSKDLKENVSIGFIEETVETLRESSSPSSDISKSSNSSQDISSSQKTGKPVQAKHTRVSRLKRKIEESSSSSDSDGFKGPIKKARKEVKVHHNYSAQPKSYMTIMKEVKKEKQSLRQKIKTTTRKVKRLKKKVTSLKKIVFCLRKKRFLTDDALSVLEQSYDGIPLMLLRRAIKNIDSSRKGKRQARTSFPAELRSFALTLQFYSTKAYNYVRKTFNLALPSLSTIRGWVKNINCEPGFTDCSFVTIKKKVEENKNKNRLTICSLMLDEMSMRKQIEVRGTKTWGYEDLGTEIKNDSMKCATECLTLMAVAVNSHWKIPIAYFFITSLGGTVKANIVTEAIRRLTEIGVKVLSVTCDGPSAHFTMAEHLGAKLNDMNNLKPYFTNVSDNSRSFIIFDAVHMLKLMRNCWATLGIILDLDGNKIDYSLITKLYSIQEKEFCRIGTKLRKQHMEWASHKMKVKLAAQTLSASVADALEFLSEVHSEFKESKPTINFIRIIDQLFDMANSRNPFEKGKKAPLRRSNEHIWRPALLNGINYLKGLKNVNGVPLYETQRKTPIRGLCITLTSLLGLYDSWVAGQNSPLNYLLTYKFSQDHLELFFCCVRSRNGFNNNPTAFQFYYTYKRLTLNLDLKCEGNCSILDGTSILSSNNDRAPVMPTITLDDMSVVRKYNMDLNDFMVSEDDMEGVARLLPKLSVISENVVAYISGFVIKTLKKKLKCAYCLGVVEEKELKAPNANLLLFQIKNRGGLVRPKQEVINVCSYIEKKIRQTLAITNNFMPKENNFIKLFNQQVAMYLFENNFLPDLDEHILTYSFEEENHRMKVIKLITQIYTRLRFFNIAKKQTENVTGQSVRKIYSKLILFHHQ